MASRRRFLGHGSWLEVRDESVMAKASILLPNRHDFRHDLATIVVLILRRSHADRHHTTPNKRRVIVARSRRDRGPITAQSDRDRGFFHVLSAPSDSASGERMIVVNLIPYTPIIGSVRRQPSDEFLIAPR